MKAVAIPTIHKAPPAERITDAAVYYVQQNAILAQQGKKIGLRKAGEQFDTASVRQINEAVHKLELSGAAEELRRAALEALETTTTAAIASAVQPPLTPKAAYKASYKAATRAHADGATLEAARSAALQEYKIAPCLETIRVCENPGASPPKRGRKPPMGVDAEKFLARAVRACAARKIPLFKDGIMSGANAIVESYPWMKSHFGK